MEKQLLGHVIRADRLSLGISQERLQQKVRILSIEDNEDFTKKEKEALKKSYSNYVNFNGKNLYVPIPSKLISNIERGISRSVLNYELSLISRALCLEEERYFGLEVNPMKFVNNDNYSGNINKNSWFDRSIEFDPEHRQAGVSILSFFSEVVKSEFSDQNVRVGILQDGNKVTLRIETPEGELLKEIEKTLEKYGLVVMGSAPIESLSENRELIRDLKTRLEVTNLELRLRQEAHLEHKEQYKNRIINLEDQVKQLHCMIGSNLAHYTNLTEIIRSLVADDRIIKTLGSALKIIDKISTSEFTEKSAKKLEDSLGEIEEKSPGLIKRLTQTMESVPASVLSNIASPWVQSFFWLVSRICGDTPVSANLQVYDIRRLQGISAS